MINDLMGNTILQVESRKDDMIQQEDIRNELARIIESSLFVQSDRLGRFLRFTVETTLEGKGATLKEYLIGTVVYDRKSDYHPGEDSIVRSEARRLRRKLQEYYQSIGKNDPVFIYYRPGSYVPVFKNGNGQSAKNPSCVPAWNSGLTKGQGIRLAVMPLVDVSINPSGACAQLITNELIHALVRTDGLHVTAIGAMAFSPEESVDCSSLAHRLGVDIVLEGTVSAENSKLRITLRMLSADGFHIWSERFETVGDSQGLFVVSERLASALVSRIEPEQLVACKRAAAGPQLSAYSQVLRAEALLDAGTLADAQSALCRFEAITASEPGYARSLCGIALCKCEIALRGMRDSSSAVHRAREAAEQAASLEPQMTLVPACMGFVLALEWNWREAESTFREAVGLGEHAGTYLQYALVLAALERFDEAWNYIQRAHQIDPFSYRQKIAYTKLFQLSRHYAQGLEHLSEQLVYGPLPVESELYQAMMLASLDRRDEALQLALSLRRKSGAQPAIMSGIAEVLATCGEPCSAKRIVADYDLLSTNPPISRFRQALLSVALGNPSQAISYLTSAYEQREPELIWLGCDPRMDAVRDDPRYLMILNSVTGAYRHRFAA